MISKKRTFKVKTIFTKIIPGFLLIFIVHCYAVPQSSGKYFELRKFRKLGLTAGPVLYIPARIYSQSGNYTFDNKPMWGFNAGIEFDLFPAKRWSFISGLLVALEPVYNIEIQIKEEDIYPYYGEALTDHYRSYSMTSLSIPLLVRLGLQAKEFLFINFLAGFKVMLYPHGTSDLTLSISNEDNTETREIFGLKLQSPENMIHGSFVLGAGVSYVINKVLLKSNLIYVMNLQNLIEGEYLFDNLLVSHPSRGDYKLSGNYVGLLFTVGLAKKKRDKK